MDSSITPEKASSVLQLTVHGATSSPFTIQVTNKHKRLLLKKIQRKTGVPKHLLQLNSGGDIKNYGNISVSLKDLVVAYLTMKMV